LSIDDIERWFAELANSASVLRRHELVERIAAAVSRFVMIDEDILCPSLFESLKGGRGKEDSETSPTFLLWRYPNSFSSGVFRPRHVNCWSFGERVLLREDMPALSCVVAVGKDVFLCWNVRPGARRNDGTDMPRPTDRQENSDSPRSQNA